MNTHAVSSGRSVTPNPAFNGPAGQRVLLLRTPVAAGRSTRALGLMAQFLHIAAFWVVLVICVFRLAVCFPPKLACPRFVLPPRTGGHFRGETEAEYLLRCARFRAELVPASGVSISRRLGRASLGRNAGGLVVFPGVVGCGSSGVGRWCVAGRHWPPWVVHCGLGALVRAQLQALSSCHSGLTPRSSGPAGSRASSRKRRWRRAAQLER